MTTTPTLLSYEGPVCVRCAHRHRAGGPCASHVWGDECEYTATETCSVTTRPPVPDDDEPAPLLLAGDRAAAGCEAYEDEHDACDRDA